jgi:ABC-type glycerol-3-phosphate transport system permease component
MKRRLLPTIGIYLAALAVFLFFVAPLLWMVSTAFKPQVEWFSTPPRLIPEHPNLDNFTRLFSTDFPQYFLNSALVGVFATIPTILIGIGAAYAMTFLRWRGRNMLVGVILLTQLLPTAVTVLPLYQTASSMGQLDSLIALAVAYMSFTTPVAVWLLVSFLAHLPFELQEAAQVDGATKLGGFVRVMLPLAAPGIISTAVYAFFSAWQEFLLALTFLTTKGKLTLPVGILGFIGQYETNWGEMMAASLVLTIPLFLVFASLQKYLITGLSQGAVKG